MSSFILPTVTEYWHLLQFKRLFHLNFQCQRCQKKPQTTCYAQKKRKKDLSRFKIVYLSLSSILCTSVLNVSSWMVVFLRFWLLTNAFIQFQRTQIIHRIPKSISHGNYANLCELHFVKIGCSVPRYEEGNKIGVQLKVMNWRSKL